ncbi:uncharacterized protein BO88DRAFT_93545 [Aspergillus vadensis CBS 113365]|uniref:Uncharacterized protein n=1 Tax=Aspergillus vadensis (strain CBS 113365 / IMI 142717 / IBT 24658) TaxID=1448311 RepID=A0A319C4Y3_ASPVC|nr:hypothetical protein BO88DRAFT_93545 [Aspergillus vadensis CBS 113365]PYH73373.1 hypothetical protein BO88DRAFT_93545 [Aspergillus vadensis CBS 113365]
MHKASEHKEGFTRSHVHQIPVANRSYRWQAKFCKCWCDMAAGTPRCGSSNIAGRSRSVTNPAPATRYPMATRTFTSRMGPLIRRRVKRREDTSMTCSRPID